MRLARLDLPFEADAVGVDLPEAAREDQALRRTELFLIQLVAFGTRRLTLQGVGPTLDLPEDVVHPLEVQVRVD